MTLFHAVLAQVKEPYPPPPIIFDLIVSLIFIWVGWRAWKRGRGWKSGAVVMWLLAIGGLYTFVRGVMVG